jgi:glycosyltransferase involved in cell wall biosynthesis
MKISVVVPAYNEEHRILPSLQRVLAYLEAHHSGFEVLVIDDGSRDRTAAVVRDAFGTRQELRLLEYGRNRGKGYAVRYGALRAQGDLVLFTDADLSTPIEELDKMLPLLEQGADLVIGSRAHAHSDIRRHQHLFREAAGKLFNVCVRLIVRLPFHDTQCGFKVFRRSSMQAVLQHLQVDRFAFDVELIAVALALGRRVKDVPVVWVNSPASTVTLWSGLEAYGELFAIRRRARRLTAEHARAGEHAAAPPTAQ